MDNVEIFQPEPLLSNLYAKISSIRSERVVPKSEEDEDYAIWKESIKLPRAILSDEEIKKIIYEKSRFIDRLTEYWFYPKDLKVVISHENLYAYNYFFPAPLISPDDFKVVIRTNKEEAIILDRTTELTEWNFKLDLRTNFESSIEFNPDLFTKKRYYRTPFEVIRYNGDFHFFDFGPPFESYDLHRIFESAKDDILMFGTFGFLENGGVPEPIQRVCSYMVMEEVERKRRGQLDGMDRGSLIKESTDGHSYELARPGETVDNRGGVFLTGSTEIDTIIAAYIKPKRQRMVIV